MRASTISKGDFKQIMAADEIEETSADSKNHLENRTEQLIDHNTFRNEIKRIRRMKINRPSKDRKRCLEADLYLIESQLF